MACIAIVMKSQRAGKRILHSISRYLENRLKLVVNTSKSRVVKTNSSRAGQNYTVTPDPSGKYLHKFTPGNTGTVYQFIASQEPVLDAGKRYNIGYTVENRLNLVDISACSKADEVNPVITQSQYPFFEQFLTSGFLSQNSAHHIEILFGVDSGERHFNGFGNVNTMPVPQHTQLFEGFRLLQ